MRLPQVSTLAFWGRLVIDRRFRSVRNLTDVMSRLPLASLTLLLCLVAVATPALPAQNAQNAQGAQNATKPHRKVLVMFEPEYPTILKNGHFEGQVRLEATVLATGTVTKVECKGGNPMLAQYAQQAVMRWKYAPAPAQTVEDVVFVFNANSH